MTAITISATAAATEPPASPLRRAVAVRGWLAGGGIYFGGVMNRTSLGIAALAAGHRFGIGPAQLSVFVILQLGLYAAMQVPTGVLVDRFGSRRLLLAASGLIGLAGFGFAFAPNYPTALLARGLLGCGDAMTYISVLRFAGTNFSRRRFPQVIVVTSLFGFVATLLATVPLSLLLHAAGWELTFSILAAIPVLAGIVVCIVMPAPARVAESPAPNSARTRRSATFTSVGQAWRTPGTRLGFWVHFSCMSTATVFAALWGLPYLVAVGFSKSGGSNVLLLCVVVAIVVSLSMGVVVAARPILRVPIAFGACILTIAGWVPLLAAGGDHPNRTLVTGLVALMAVGPPISSVAFLLARDYNRSASGGTATGVVNGAGFIATILCAGAIGGVLELMGSTASGFRVAFGAAIAIQAFGTFRIAVWWRRVRAGLLVQTEKGLPVPVLVVRHPWDLAAERLVERPISRSTIGAVERATPEPVGSGTITG
jgi:MFS family permease